MLIMIIQLPYDVFLTSVPALLMDWLYVLNSVVIMSVFFHWRGGHVMLLFQDTTMTQALSSVRLSNMGAVMEIQTTLKRLKSVRGDARQKVCTSTKWTDYC